MTNNVINFNRVLSDVQLRLECHQYMSEFGVKPLTHKLGFAEVNYRFFEQKRKDTPTRIYYS